jgi:hypothetical protein
MTYFYLVFAIFFSVNVIGQSMGSFHSYKNIDEDFSSNHQGLIVGFGQIYLTSLRSSSYLQPQFDRSFSNRIQLAMIGMRSLLVTSDGFYFDGQSGYSFFIPQTVVFSDSLKQTLSGYCLTSEMGADLYRGSEVIDLLLGAGIGFGRQKIKVKSENPSIDDALYRNPYFAIKAYVEPKLVVWFLTLSVRIEFICDISKSKWKYRNESLTPMGATKTTGLLLQGCMGFLF